MLCLRLAPSLSIVKCFFYLDISHSANAFRISSNTEFLLFIFIPLLVPLLLLVVWHMSVDQVAIVLWRSPVLPNPKWRNVWKEKPGVWRHRHSGLGDVGLNGEREQTRIPGQMQTVVAIVNSFLPVGSNLVREYRIETYCSQFKTKSWKNLSEFMCFLKSDSSDVQ